MAKRSYFDEINEIEDSWNTILSNQPVINGTCTPEWLKGTIFCIGSGGAYVGARLWQQVYENRGLGLAKAMTPYEFLNQTIKPDIVALFSASGKNHDILDAFRYTMEIGCKILVFTISGKSDLLRLARTFNQVTTIIRPGIGIPRDGFLAVNSTIAMAGLIYQIDEMLFKNSLSNYSPVRTAANDYHDNPLINPHKYRTIQVVTSEWGVSAGVDLETRLSESGIAACFVTDPRSFGHGRFIWLQHHKEDTLVVVINTKTSTSFSNKFIKTLPEFCSKYHINAPEEGLWGAIYCLTITILLFGDLAESSGIDPGKPEVPEWGKKLHGLKVRKTTKIEKSRIYPALYLDFNSIVIDIDGTLVDTDARFNPISKEISNELNRLLELGLRLGFATGRGGSAIDILRGAIAEKFWTNTFVGIYNGTCIVNLAQDIQLNGGYRLALYKDLIDLVNELTINYKVEIVPRETQISIRGLKPSVNQWIKSEISSRLGQRSSYYKFLSSAHSLDIVPWWATKLSVIQMMDLSLIENILCIGDQGQLGGNDEELLLWEPSISVGIEQPVSNKCWWLGKNKEFRESIGLLRVLNSIEPTSDKTRFKITVAQA